MGLFSAVFGGSGNKGAIAPNEPPVAGEAQRAASALIADLHGMQPKEIRAESTDQLLEAVIRGARLDEYTQVLTQALGEPCKPFGLRGEFARPLAQQIDEMGGVSKEQCLFLRRFEDDRIAYAALWPWGDPSSITLKVGVLTSS